VALSLHQQPIRPAQVLTMPKPRLPHEFTPVAPETLREAEDLRRYGDRPVSQIVHMPVRSRKVPFAALVQAATYIEDGIALYGRAAIVRAICSELAAEGVDVAVLTLDEIASCEEVQ
jgi:hypothetical protein